ncbi:MAG: hypothetical protein N3G80_02300 [Candidatus Micrarchaeota archaeon]|nr:hypothetical protein [Candidatus Micrarchaeota archaeon]
MQKNEFSQNSNHSHKPTLLQRFSVFKRKLLEREPSEVRQAVYALEKGVRLLDQLNIPYSPLFFILQPFSKQELSFLLKYSINPEYAPPNYRLANAKYFHPLLLSPAEGEMLLSHAGKQSMAPQIDYAAVHLAVKNPFEHVSNDKGGIILAFRKRVQTSLPPMHPLSPFYYYTKIAYIGLQKASSFVNNILPFFSDFNADYVDKATKENAHAFAEFLNKVQQKHRLTLRELVEKTQNFETNIFELFLDCTFPTNL